MADAEKEERQKTLSQALWYHVGQIIDEKTIPQNKNVTPQYIAALAQLVWTQLENTAQDLEAFANHAGRTTVSTDDVLLLCRRNQDLYDLVKDFINKEKAAAQAKAKAKPSARISKPVGGKATAAGTKKRASGGGSRSMTSLGAGSRARGGRVGRGGRKSG